MSMKFVTMADKQRLRDEGVWEAFVARREEIKGTGVPSREAAAQALLEFPPTKPLSTEPASVIARKMATRSDTRQPKKVFGDRECSPKSTVDWVARNIAVSDAKASDAPSPEAWAILQWVRHSYSNETSFWKDLWARMLPSRAQVEEEERFRDDGRRHLDLIESVKSASGD